MKKLMDLGNKYASESTWMDFALVKFCLFAMGLFIGSLIPKSKTKEVRIAAGAIFFVTYIPLVMKLYETYTRMIATEQEKGADYYAD